MPRQITSLVVNSDEEWAAVGRAIKRATSCRKNAQRIIDDYGCESAEATNLNSDLFTGAISWWIKQQTAWTETKRILSEGAKGIDELQTLLCHHMIRNNLVNHKDYDACRMGYLNFEGTMGLLKHFGYKIGVIPVTLVETAEKVDSTST